MIKKQAGGWSCPFGHGLLTHLRVLASEVEVTLLPNYVGLLRGGPIIFLYFSFYIWKMEMIKHLSNFPKAFQWFSVIRSQPSTMTHREVWNNVSCFLLTPS